MRSDHEPTSHRRVLGRRSPNAFRGGEGTTRVDAQLVLLRLLENVGMRNPHLPLGGGGANPVLESR